MTFGRARAHAYAPYTHHTHTTSPYTYTPNTQTQYKQIQARADLRARVNPKDPSSETAAAKRLLKLLGDKYTQVGGLCFGGGAQRGLGMVWWGWVGLD